MADRSGLIFLVILFLLFASTSGPRTLNNIEREQLHTYIEWKESELQTLARTPLDKPLLEVNLTNVAAATPPDEIEEKIHEIWTTGNHNSSAFFRNLSAILHGGVLEGVKFAPREMPVSPVFQDLIDSAPPKAREEMESARFQVSSHEEGVRVAAYLVADPHPSILLKGVYLDRGQLFMTTDSLKFSGYNGLPWMLPKKTPKHTLESAHQAVLARSNQSTELLVEAGDITDLDRAVAAAESCEYVLVGHVHESGLSNQDLDDLESELTHPLGRPLKRLPPVLLTGVLYSPDCGVVYDFELKGEQMENYEQRVRVVCVGVMLILLASAAVLAAQMKATSTPSTLSRVSLWSIASMSLVDGAICILALVASFGSDLSLVLLAVAFVAFALTSMFELRYLVMIYKAQLTERAANARVEGLPDTEVPQIPDERVLSNQVYSRYYIALLAFFAINVLSFGWEKQTRSLYERLLLLVLYSSWVPQIALNVRRGHQTVLLPSFIVGSSILRLLPALYFCFYSKNVGYHHYAPNLGWILLGWQWLQVIVLISQHIFGPRFFLPAHMVAAVYDYHPILTADLEQGLNAEEPPVTEAGPSLPPGENGVLKQVSCAICMNPVDLIICEEGVPPGPGALVARRNYMVTPCRHIYHTDCLDQWMQKQLQCPICRNPLPPI